MSTEENTKEAAEYAHWIDIDPVKEPELMWIAREGLVAPIPEHWTLCKSENGEVYYHNEKTGDKSWDHPSDSYYRNLAETERAKLKNNNASGSGSAAASPAPAANNTASNSNNTSSNNNTASNNNNSNNGGSNSPYTNVPPPPPVDQRDPEPAPPPPPPATTDDRRASNTQPPPQRDPAPARGSESHRDQQIRRELWSDINDPPRRRTKGGSIRRGDSFLDSDEEDVAPSRYSKRPYTPRSGSPSEDIFPHRVARPSSYGRREASVSRSARYRTDSEGEFSYWEDESADDEPSEPTPREIRQYALYLGMQLPQDEDLLWIAREGLIEPLPKAWRQRRRRDGAVYFFNTETRETAWEHPVDDKYRRLYKTIRRKQRSSSSRSRKGTPRSRARYDEEWSDDEGYFRPDMSSARHRGIDQRFIDSSRTRSPNRTRAVSRVRSATERGPRSSRKPDYVYDIDDLPRGSHGGVLAEDEHDVLDEYVDPNYKPTTREVREYAKHLGFDVERDKRYFWIAQQGLRTPLSAEWKPCRSSSGHVYYFNFDKGESVWEHPVDTMCKQKYAEEKQKERLKSWSAPLQYSEDQQSFLYETHARFQNRAPTNWTAYPHPRHLPNQNPRRNGEQAWGQQEVPNENARRGHSKGSSGRLQRVSSKKQRKQSQTRKDDEEEYYTSNPQQWYQSPYKYNWQVNPERQAPLRDVSSGRTAVDRSVRREYDTERTTSAAPRSSRRRIGGSRRPRSISPPPPPPSARGSRRGRSRSPPPRGPPRGPPIRTVSPPPRVVHVYDGPPQTPVPTRVNPVLRSMSANQAVTTTPIHPTNRPGPAPVATTQRYDHPRQIWSGASNWQQKR